MFIMLIIHFNQCRVRKSLRLMISIACLGGGLKISLRFDNSLEGIFESPCYSSLDYIIISEIYIYFNNKFAYLCHIPLSRQERICI